MVRARYRYERELHGRTRLSGPTATYEPRATGPCRDAGDRQLIERGTPNRRRRSGDIYFDWVLAASGS